jgi:hypothetical protein
VVQVEQELVIETLDVLVRTNTLLQVLILTTTVNRIVDHDTIDFRIIVGFQDGFFYANTDVWLVTKGTTSRANEPELVFDAEGFTGFTCELEGKGNRRVSDERSV